MFYLIELVTYNNGTADSKGIYNYDTEELAIANFHSKLGGAMKNATYESELLVVMNDDGGIIRDEKWSRYHELEQED